MSERLIEDVREMRSLPLPIETSLSPRIQHQFRLRSSGASEIHLGSPGSLKVLISSADTQRLDADWALLCEIVSEAHARRPPRGEAPRPAPGSVFPRQTQVLHRPMALLESGVLSRLPDGSVCLLGDAACLMAGLDRRFTQHAETEDATPIVCPPIWQASQLPSFGYDPHSPNLLSVQRPGNPQALYWQLAACNNVWQHLSGTQLARPTRFSVRGICCRAEGGQYFLLERMRSFSMREVTCAGSEADVRAFQARALSFLGTFAESLGLGGRLCIADDPFFLLEEGSADEEEDASKTELRLDIYDDKTLACASVNVHRDFFSRRLGISSIDDQAVWTACLAFGLERWVWAILSQFGADPVRWPPAVRALLEA